MRNFKKNAEDFFVKNSIRYKKGTIERQRQDFLAWREKKQQSQKKTDKNPTQLELFSQDFTK